MSILCNVCLDNEVDSASDLCHQCQYDLTGVYVDDDAYAEDYDDGYSTDIDDGYSAIDDAPEEEAEEIGPSYIDGEEVPF